MKITFSKFSVSLMYIMIIGYLAICLVIRSWPPAEFTYCWFGFWSIQAVLTTILRNSKRKHEFMKILVGEFRPYINNENALKILERITNIDFEKGSKKNNG
jgi:hypothetical protein